MRWLTKGYSAKIRARGSAMASLGKSAVKIMVVMLLLGAANSAHALGTLDLTAWTPRE